MKRLYLIIYIWSVALQVVLGQPRDAVALPTDTSATGWYNIGNACYRNHEIAKAILCYERYLRLAPSNEDAAYNLARCRTMIADRFGTPQEMFFVSWIKQLIYGYSTSAWLFCSLIFMALFGVAWLCFRHAHGVRWRQIAFYVAILWGMLSLFSLLSAGLAYHRLQTERSAVVMRTTPARLSSTRSAAVDRELHSGTTLLLTGVVSPDSLAACLLPDGTEAWIEPLDCEEVKVP